MLDYCVVSSVVLDGGVNIRELFDFESIVLVKLEPLIHDNSKVDERDEL